MEALPLFFAEDDFRRPPRQLRRRGEHGQRVLHHEINADPRLPDVIALADHGLIVGRPDPREIGDKL